MYKTQSFVLGALLCVLLCLSFAKVEPPQPIKIKPTAVFKLKVPEPSGLAALPNKDSLLIVSDKGYVYLTDAQGKIALKSQYIDADLEAITIWNDSLCIAVSERNRKLHVLSTRNLQLIRSLEVPYAGGRNQSFESITHIGNDTFLLFTETHPVWMYKVHLAPHGPASILSIQNMDDPFSELSDVCFYNEKVWMLSDENAHISVVPLHHWWQRKIYQLSILNAEGVTINHKNQLLVVSDAGHKLYYFDLPK